MVILEKKHNLFSTHEALRSSFNLVYTCPLVPDRIGIWKCRFFWERGKPEYPVTFMFHLVFLQFCLNFDIDIS